MVNPDVEWLFGWAYDFVEERWGKVAAWLVTLALFGAFVAAVMWALARIA
jgi:hypothetical protein